MTPPLYTIVGIMAQVARRRYNLRYAKIKLIYHASDDGTTLRVKGYLYVGKRSEPYVYSGIFNREAL